MRPKSKRHGKIDNTHDRDHTPVPPSCYDFTSLLRVLKDSDNSVQREDNSSSLYDFSDVKKALNVAEAEDSDPVMMRLRALVKVKEKRDIFKAKNRHNHTLKANQERVQIVCWGMESLDLNPNNLWRKERN